MLIGVVGATGTVGYLPNRVEIDQDFVDTAAKGRNPAKRFRFAQPCAEHGYSNWTGSAFAVIRDVIAILPVQMSETIEELPHCSIRRECRWFAQEGRRACASCPLVVTDLVDPPLV